MMKSRKRNVQNLG